MAFVFRTQRPDIFKPTNAKLVQNEPPVNEQEAGPSLKIKKKKRPYVRKFICHKPFHMSETRWNEERVVRPRVFYRAPFSSTVVRNSNTQASILPGPGSYNTDSAGRTSTKFRENRGKKGSLALEIGRSQQRYLKIASIPSYRFAGYFYKNQSPRMLQQLSLASRYKGTVDDSAGPGEYHQQSTFEQAPKKQTCESSFFLSKTKRPEVTPAFCVGPGSYQNYKGLSKSPKVGRTGSEVKRSLIKQPLKLSRLQSEASEDDEQFTEYQKNATPGPGSYTMYPEATKKTFQYHMAQEFVKTPGIGPGEYNAREPCYFNKRNLNSYGEGFGSTDSKYRADSKAMEGQQWHVVQGQFERKMRCLYQQGYKGQFLWRTKRFPTQESKTPAPNHYFRQSMQAEQSTKNAVVQLEKRVVHVEKKESPGPTTYSNNNYSVYTGLKKQHVRLSPDVSFGSTVPKSKLVTFTKGFVETPNRSLESFYGSDKPAKPRQRPKGHSPQPHLVLQLERKWVQRSFNRLFREQGPRGK